MEELQHSEPELLTVKLNHCHDEINLLLSNLMKLITHQYSQLEVGVLSVLYTVYLWVTDVTKLLSFSVTLHRRTDFLHLRI